jgi:hypothetical protein
MDTPKGGPFELVSYRLGALPLVNCFIGRAGLPGALARWLPARDRRLRLGPAVAIRLVVVNLLAGRAPLHGLGEQAAPFAPALLGLAEPDAAWLDDDRVGRALDRLFHADRASMLTELIVGVAAEFGVDTSQPRNDSASVSAHGAYRDADGAPRGGKPAPAVTFGCFQGLPARPQTAGADPDRVRRRGGADGLPARRRGTPATTRPTSRPGTSWRPCQAGGTSATSPTPNWPPARRCAASTATAAGSSRCCPAPGPRTSGSTTGHSPTSPSRPKRSACPAPEPANPARRAPPSPPRCPRPRAACVIWARSSAKATRDVTRHEPHRNGQLVQTFEPHLTPLRQQVLKLLGVPTTTYTNPLTNQPTTPRPQAGGAKSRLRSAERQFRSWPGCACVGGRVWPGRTSAA